MKIIIAFLFAGLIIFAGVLKKQPIQKFQPLTLIADETWQQQLPSDKVYILTYNQEIRKIIETNYHTYFKCEIISDDETGYSSRGYQYFYTKQNFKPIKL